MRKKNTMRFGETGKEAAATLVRRLCLRTLLAVLLAASSVNVFAANFTVNMQNFQFSPRNLTINLGDTVTWVNRDSTAHDTVSGTNGIPSGIWRSPLFGLNGSFSFTFTNVAPRG